MNAHRSLIIRALRSHGLECIDQAMHARAAGLPLFADKWANESMEARRLADELETGRPGIGRPGIDSNGSFATAKAVT
jgi:hypothetical protein